MRKKAVFFDLGGTLLRMRRDGICRTVLAEEGYSTTTERIHSAYANAESSWLKRYGYRKLAPEKSVESYRRLDAMAFRRIFPYAPPGDAYRISSLIRKRWPELDHRFPTKLYPDAEPTLDLLKDSGYKLGLVSNAPPGTLELVKRMGLQRYMSNFVISGDVGVSKPNPEIFRFALRNAEVMPSEAVHVGDVYEADVVGADDAGMTGVLIARDSLSRRYPCPTIRNLGEVFRFLNS
jgi:putative hydrolase of the HAD superfamily